MYFSSFLSSLLLLALPAVGLPSRINSTALNTQSMTETAISKADSIAPASLNRLPWGSRRPDGPGTWIGPGGTIRPHKLEEMKIYQPDNTAVNAQSASNTAISSTASVDPQFGFICHNGRICPPVVKVRENDPINNTALNAQSKTKTTITAISNTASFAPTPPAKLPYSRRGDIGWIGNGGGIPPPSVQITKDDPINNTTLKVRSINVTPMNAAATTLPTSHGRLCIDRSANGCTSWICPDGGVAPHC